MQQILAGLRILPLRDGGQGQAVERASVVGLGGQGRLPAATGVIVATRAIQRGSEIHEQIGIVGRQRQGVFEACGSERKTALGCEIARQLA